MSTVNTDDVLKAITHLAVVSARLPTAKVAIRRRQDKIYHVVTKVVGEEDFHTFNRQFDVELFGLGERSKRI